MVKFFLPEINKLNDLNADLEQKIRVTEEELDLFNPRADESQQQDEEFNENTKDIEGDHETYSDTNYDDPVANPPAKRTRLSLTHPYNSYSQPPAQNQSYTDTANSANPNAGSYSQQQQPYCKYLPKLSDVPLDTASIANIIRNILLQEKIGQRLFAKEVAGITQSALSDMLLKPKLWEECTDYKKRLYQKMLNWSHNREKVLHLKNINVARDRRSTIILNQNSSSFMNHLPSNSNSQVYNGASLNASNLDVNGAHVNDDDDGKLNGTNWDESGDLNVSNCDDLMANSFENAESSNYQNNVNCDEDFFGEHNYTINQGT
jgi:hypothetical protein